MDERLVVGVDGGGTATRAVLATAAGDVLGRGTSGPGNLGDVGDEGLRRHLGEAVGRAFDEARRPRAPAAAAFLGLAGVARADERDRARRAAVLAGIAAADAIGVDHDLRAAHAGALCGAPGLVLVAGTGSACYGRAASGASARAGGFGPLFDDAGSGHDLGRRALAAAARAHDGRGPATALGGALVRHLALDDLADLRRVRPARVEVAELAPLVLEHAAAGDAVAQRIVAGAADELALMAEAVARRLGETAPRVALSGGLLRAGGPLASPVSAALRARLPEADVVGARLRPELGALLLALDRLGVTASEDVLAGWSQEAPPPGGGPRRSGSRGKS